MMRLLLLLALAGCGGQEPRQLVFYGDSITATDGMFRPHNDYLPARPMTDAEFQRALGALRAAIADAGVLGARP